MMEDDTDQYTQIYNYKILILGDIGTGKTSILKRYVDDDFVEGYKSTIGVDFMLKRIDKNINGSNCEIRLQLWDVAGQERFGNMTSTYYREAVGAFIVFDVTRPNTYESANTWKVDIDSKLTFPNGKTIPTVLLANKTDLLEDGSLSMMFEHNIDEYCKSNGFSEWFQTSAKNGSGIEDAADHLISSILKEVGNDNVWDRSPGSFQIQSYDQFPIDDIGDEGCNCSLM